jgi:DNA-binding transcriptional MocR family regulator
MGLVERLGRWSSGRGALYLLLAARIRTLIDEGELRPGARLPPDRALASALVVGRSTVDAADPSVPRSSEARSTLQMLILEGELGATSK